MTDVVVRNTRESDFEAIRLMTTRVYPGTPPWSPKQLASHLAVFPEGQFVAEVDGRVVGMAASLIVLWEDYDLRTAWRDFTDMGMFTNHDPVNGKTLYGAEVMVDPDWQGHGIGSKLYEARRDLTIRLGLRRIRAGARLRDYHRVASHLSPEAYVEAVVRGDLRDATLTFQVRRDFRVIAVVSGYLVHDPESLGYAAVIEWKNPEYDRPDDNGPARSRTDGADGMPTRQEPTGQ